MKTFSLSLIIVVFALRRPLCPAPRLLRKVAMPGSR